MIARNNNSGVKFREEKFLYRRGSLNSRNFIPDHLTPLRKINSPGIYFPGFLRNEYSWTFLVQEYLFLALLGICVPEENIFLTSVIIINNCREAPLAERHVFAKRFCVCLFVCLFFRTNEKQAILLYFGTNEKLELEGILFMSGYPQIFRISQKIRISPKNFYTPRFFFDFFIFFLKMWIFPIFFFSISGIFLKMWIFPKKKFSIFFFSISDFFRDFGFFSKN